MHIPDGFLSPQVWLSLNLISAPAVALLARKAQRGAEESRVPLLGVMGAFVFAAQMVNFPVGVGVSGHLVGSLLLAVTLGPAAAAIVMTAVLAIQALVFQDGGLLALGANVFNMALAGVLAGYLPYALWGAGRFRSLAILAGGVLSVGVGAALAVAELMLSGVRIPGPVLGLSAGLFLVNGILEGLITLAVLGGIAGLNAALIRRPAAGARAGWSVIGLGAVLLAAAGVLFASQAPDVLEWLSEGAGIAHQARVLLPSPLADYRVSVLGDSWAAAAAAALAGLGLLCLAGLAIGRLVARRRSG